VVLLRADLVGRKAPADFGSREKLPALEKQVTTRTPSSRSSISRGHTAARKYWPRIRRKLTGKYKPFGVTIDQAAMAMTDDLHEHLGQLIVYSRSVGVKPPWSK
jgi:hypothetical protein